MSSTTSIHCFRPTSRLGASLWLAVLWATACSGGGAGEDASPQGAPVATTFSVSGTIPVPAGSAIDGDVNDPSAPFVSNDTPGTAQEIPVPVTLGGYANVPGGGSPGRSWIRGDALDYYRVALAAGQQIRLFLAEDGSRNDLDLVLLRLDGEPVATRDGVERVMEIDVPEGDVYLIEVSAISGASNYVLSIGQGDDPGAAQAALEPDFVPGEIIVRLADGARRPDLSDLGLRRIREVPDGASLLGCHDQAGRRRALVRLGLGHLVAARADELAVDPDVRLRRETRRLAKALQREVGVRAASPNYIRSAHATPSDEHYALQWHLPEIGLPLAWDNLLALDPSERTSEPVIVAVIDTGVTASHPDLQGQLVAGYDFIRDAAAAKDGDGCDPDPEDLGDGLLGSASSYHGTHVTGTIVARTSLQSSGGDSLGVAGAAFDARVMPLRVLGVGGGTDFDIMQAVSYAAALPNDCGVQPAAPADIINLSLGGPGFNAAFQLLIDEVRLAGVTVVASAGNEASGVPSYPAAFDGVISVAATDAAGALAFYSNFGPTVDVAAPGGDLSADVDGDGFADGILSTWVEPSRGDPIYGFAQGTSMAAPHVSAVIALMLDVNPGLNPFDIDLLLADGSLSDDDAGLASIGHGLIDAFAAVSAAFSVEGGVPPVNLPRLAASAGSLDFGSLADELPLELSNVGGTDEALVVHEIRATTADGGVWLSVQADSTDANGLGLWTVRVDREALGPDVIHAGTLAIDSSHNDLELGVIVRTRSLGSSVDAGHHFVLLVDPDSLFSVAELQVDISGGAYEFRFDAVDPGSYLVVAGTDSDNDQIICDPGEACGAYPARDGLEPLVVDRDVTDADFPTGFSTAFEAKSAGPGGEAGVARPGARRSPPGFR
jgi:serine protease